MVLEKTGIMTNDVVLLFFHKREVILGLVFIYYASPFTKQTKRGIIMDTLS